MCYNELDMHYEVTESMGVRGFVTASVFDMRSPKALQLERDIEHLLRQPVHDREMYLALVNELSWLFKVREHRTQNLIATVGRSALMKRLANITTYTGIINYGALGTGTNAPANANTHSKPKPSASSPPLPVSP